MTDVPYQYPPRREPLNWPGAVAIVAILAFVLGVGALIVWAAK